jgi:hypothetical protein
MKPTLDHSGFVQNSSGSMDGNGVRRRADDEPHGFLPRAWAAGPPAWRRMVAWLFGDRDAVDQQGLLAERSLFRSASRHQQRPGAERSPAPRGDERWPRPDPRRGG